MRTGITILFLIILNLGLQAKPIKVMLLTGQTDKYHNWEVTSSYLKAVLDHHLRKRSDLPLCTWSYRSRF